MSASIVAFNILFFRNYFQSNISNSKNKPKDAAFHIFPKQVSQCEIND